MLTFDLLASKVKFASLFVWAIYIYIESIEVTFTQVSEPWPVGLLFKLSFSKQNLSGIPSVSDSLDPDHYENTPIQIY